MEHIKFGWIGSSRTPLHEYMMDETADTSHERAHPSYGRL